MSTFLLLIIAGYLTYRYFRWQNAPRRYTVEEAKAGGYYIVSDVGKYLRVEAEHLAQADADGNRWYPRRERYYATKFYNLDYVKAQASKMGLKIQEDTLYFESPTVLCRMKKDFYSWLQKEC